MENFNSDSEDISSAFLFYNHSLYLQQLVKYEHSKNTLKSIFTLGFLFLSKDQLSMRACVHTELRLLPP